MLRVERVDWQAAAADVDAQGYARLPRALTAAECGQLIRMYGDASRFRSRVVMQRHGFGAGEYQYFAAPAPPLVADLRAELYPPLAQMANEWAAQLDAPERYPDTFAAFAERCVRAGQAQPTPLLLQYGPGDYNCLHRDLYGDVVFPLQLTVLLSRPGPDFTGGEFLLVEQRPRQQSRAEVVDLGRGDGVIFPVQARPVRGARGVYRAAVRHGVSRIRHGRRLALGIIFHNAP